MDFEVFTTNVDLQDIPSYTTNITLEGQLLKISFVWNERIGKRTIFIRNSADICYLQNTILHPNESFELNSNAIFDDLPYKVVLQKVGDTSKVGNIYNWSKDFILCFYRTVDIETEKLNVKYGVTAPSTPTFPKGFGNWILNQGYELVNEYIKYTAYKTNGVSYYDSFANFDLTEAIIQSLHDADMQQWQAVKDACNQLTGNNKYYWTSSGISYAVSDGRADPSDTIIYRCETVGFTACLNGKSWKSAEILCEEMSKDELSTCASCCTSVGGNILSGYAATGRELHILSSANPEYNPAWVNPNTLHISFSQIAQKIISNASSSNQAISMFAEAYIQEVCNSLFNTDTSKQFVKLEGLIPQLEVNKVLR